MAEVAAVGQRVVDETKKEVGQVEDRTHNYISDLADDPGRSALAVVTAGASEQVRSAGVELQSGMEREAKRNMPQLGDPISPSTPAQPAPTEPKKEDPIAESIGEQRRARGRASNILTGRRGLASSSTTARRTLLGV